MQRYIEKAGDAAQYIVGVPLFVVVAAATGVVMAVGFGVIETVDRLRHLA
jgi:hypothetical protein